MDIEHVRYMGETVECSVCGTEATLPRDDRTWPTPRRVLRDRVWLEVPATKQRPDGSQGFAMPPKLDALVEFILEHRVCIGDVGPLPDPPPPVRRPGTCILGPVTIVPGEVYRIIVVDKGARERREFPTWDDALAGIEAAQEELAIKHDGEGR
jgi:hypothetical protein